MNNAAMENKKADDATTKKPQVEKKDLVAVILAPLMSGEMSIKDRILQGTELLRRNSGKVDQEEYMRLVYYTVDN